MAAPKVCIGIPFTVWNTLVEESVRACLKLDYTNFVLVLAPDRGCVLPDWVACDSRLRVRPTDSHMIAVKRNQGLYPEDADFYGCLDSDSYPREDWLRNAMQCFASEPEVLAVGGPNLSPIYQEVEKRAVAASLKSFFVSGPRVFTKRADAQNRYVEDLQTCNLLFSKEAIGLSGGFDEALHTGEDTDLCHKIRFLGGKILFSKDVVVHHHNRALWLPYMKQKIVFGYAVPKCLSRKFEAKHFFMVLPFLFLCYALAGWAAWFLSPWLLLPWALVMVAYLAFAFVEAVRWADAAGDVPSVLAAMIIGNISPGVGTAMALLKIPIAFKKFYVNYEASHFVPTKGDAEQV